MGGDVTLTIDDMGQMRMWEPTAALRWAPPASTTTHSPILQQAWMDRASGDVEWRNVPVEIIPDDEFNAVLSE